jgi:hypothetical protein
MPRRWRPYKASGVPVALAFAACVHSAASQAGGDVAAILASSFRAERDRFVPGRAIVSPYQHTTERPPPRWAASDLAVVLADSAVELARVDLAACTQPEPLTCSIRSGEVGVVFAAPRITGDRAEVRMRVLARQDGGTRFSMSHIAHSLARQRGAWVVIGRRWLGGT